MFARAAQLPMAACRHVLVATSSSGGDNSATPIGIDPDDHRWRCWLRDDYRLRRRYLRRAGLHRGYHACADALLLKGDQILRL